MKSLPKSANRLIQEFSNLPGIGRKTAQRLTFHILKTDMERVSDLSRALMHVKERVYNCKICYGITEESICSICKDPDRDENVICVVENSYDIVVFEKTNGFKGKYHVLGGTLSPLDGIGPEELNIKRDGPIIVNKDPEIRYLIWEDLYNEIIFNFKFKNKRN